MSRCELVVIGASSGGLAAVGALLAALPAGFGAPVLCVLHRLEQADSRLGELLDRRTALPVREVEDKAPRAGGCVHLAPPGYHVLVEERHFALSTEGRVRFSRPSIDVALESAAEALGPGVVGVVLTGANDDGAAGLAAVRRRGGVGIVQDPASSASPAMPAAAVAAADPQLVVALDEIAPILARLT